MCSADELSVIDRFTSSCHSVFYENVRIMNIKRYLFTYRTCNCLTIALSYDSESLIQPFLFDTNICTNVM